MQEQVLQLLHSKHWYYSAPNKEHRGAERDLQKVDDVARRRNTPVSSSSKPSKRLRYKIAGRSGRAPDAESPLLSMLSQQDQNVHEILHL